MKKAGTSHSTGHKTQKALILDSETEWSSILAVNLLTIAYYVHTEYKFAFLVFSI